MKLHFPHLGGHEAGPTIAQVSNQETELPQNAQYPRTGADEQAELASAKAAEKWGVADESEGTAVQPNSEATPAAEIPAVASPEAQPDEAVAAPEEQAPAAEAPADTDHQIPA